MGVLNVTPDSFSDGGSWLDPADAVTHALALLAGGADLIDVGGESTRPGSERVSAAEELARVLPVVEALVDADAIVSVDTTRAEVAAQAVDAGARLVNDVSGGDADPEMLAFVAAAGVPYICMHRRGDAADMDARATYRDVVAEVAAELSTRPSVPSRPASRPVASRSTRAWGSQSWGTTTGGCSHTSTRCTRSATPSSSERPASDSSAPRWPTLTARTGRCPSATPRLPQSPRSLLARVRGRSGCTTRHPRATP
jgi:hypothetical protein